MSAEERTSGTLTFALLAIVLVVVSIFAFNSSAVPSHWYGLFKAVHLVFAVVWVGGGALITILTVVAERKDDPLELAHIARQAAMVGERLFAPAGLIVFLIGVAMMINTN